MILLSVLIPAPIARFARECKSRYRRARDLPNDKVNSDSIDSFMHFWIGGRLIVLGWIFFGRASRRNLLASLCIPLFVDVLVNVF